MGRSGEEKDSDDDYEEDAEDEEEDKDAAAAKKKGPTLPAKSAKGVSVRPPPRAHACTRTARACVHAHGFKNRSPP